LLEFCDHPNLSMSLMVLQRNKVYKKGIMQKQERKTSQTNPTINHPHSQATRIS